jgi:hypothetical protein
MKQSSSLKQRCATTAANGTNKNINNSSSSNKSGVQTDPVPASTAAVSGSTMNKGRQAVVRMLSE